jgi:hypothetical protein
MTTAALPPITAPAPVLGFLLVHAALRRESADLVATVSAGDPVLDRVVLLDKVIRAHHHGEDRVLLPLLRSREPAVRDIADEVEAQHHRLDDALDRLRTRAADGRPVHDEVTGLAASLDAHLVLEETGLLPVWVASLSPVEHERFARRLRRATPWRDVAVMVPWLLDAVPPELRTDAESELPAPIRFAYRHRLRQAFEQHWRPRPLRSRPPLTAPVGAPVGAPSA